MTQDPFTPESERSESERQPTAGAAESSPPLGIIHLLLWMTCSAVLIVANRQIRNVLESHSSIVLSQTEFFEAFQAILSGPAVASLAIWFVRLVRGQRFPIQPGEWLLVTTGIMTLIYSIYRLSWILPSLSGMNYSSIGLISMFISLVAALMFTAIALLPPLAKWWRIEFLILAGISFLRLLTGAAQILGMYMGAAVFMSFELIPLIGLIYCLSRDHSRHVTRGWMHWTGVSVFSLKVLSFMAFSVYRLLTNS